MYQQNRNVKLLLAIANIVKIFHESIPFISQQKQLTTRPLLEQLLAKRQRRPLTKDKDVRLGFLGPHTTDKDNIIEVYNGIERDAMVFSAFCKRAAAHHQRTNERTYEYERD